MGGVGGPFDFVPEGYDWQGAALKTVQKYPIPCVLAAVAVGYWIGRHRGRAVTAAATALATNLVVKKLGRVLETGDI